MVGAAVGCGLATNKLTKSLRVAIIDGKPLTEGLYNLPKIDGVPDPRVSALTPSTVKFLEEMDAWRYISNCRHAPFDSMQVWDYTGLGYTRYNATDVGKHELGYVVENKVILSALYHRIQDLGFTSLIFPANVKAVKGCEKSSSARVKEGTDCETNNKGLAQVELDDGQLLHARLVVGADGGSSKVRTMVGLQSFKKSYEQEALVCTLETSSTHSRAWQRFLPTGPVAILPMGGTFSNIVWSTTPSQAHDLKNMSDEDFVAKVNEALVGSFGPFPSSHIPHLLASPLGSFLGVTSSSREPFEPPPHITKCLSKRASFPLSLAHAYKYATDHVVLVGDAAHTVHPLAGQGVNLGFGDAATLVNILCEGVEVGADIGEVSLLERYEKKQRLTNLPMMAIMDGFQRAFSVDLGPINFARAAAFRAVQFFSPLKRQVISYAMGEGATLIPKNFQL
ncbi:hypothetical protein KP509_02G068400 [Ceratopteris richardii]|nr:hypothetical protein KP509_02G068400 [Ceratopteris richardii]